MKSKKPAPQEESEWEEILTMGKLVADAHHALIEAADTLAIHLQPLFWKDDVLKQCLPLKAADRHNSQRIIDWLNSKKEFIIISLENKRVKNEKEAQKTALLNKLGLSEEEKELLGL